MNKPIYMKPALLTALCGLGLWAGNAAAHGDNHGYRGDHDRGAQLERRLDRKGDRIERRLDRIADGLRAEGRYAEARRLERMGDRIDHRLDRKGERINRKLDRKGEWLQRDRDRRWVARQSQPHGHKHRHQDHRDYRRVYVYEPRPYRAVPREPGVTISFDLGRWVIRP
jgi:hypothetical protein